MNIGIRSMEPGDWIAMRALNIALFKNDSAFDPQLDQAWPLSEQANNYYKKVSSGTYGYGIVAVVADEIVGYVSLKAKKFDHRKGNYVEVLNLIVAEKYRSHGIGKKLMEASQAWAKAQGADRLLVQVCTENTRASAFYESFGLKPVHTNFEMDI